MSSTPELVGTATPSPAGGARGRALLWAVVVVAVALRLPFLAAPAHPDEAGFLQVAAQWSPGGRSLYGDYWVDRPPLLITLFQVAWGAGGLVALRLIGCLAVALTVLLTARTARVLAGPTASLWTAATAAGLLVAPQLGTQSVNGELLATPFVAGGVLALVASSRRPSSTWLPLVGGACATCAVLVKQNQGDVVVFAVALVAASWWGGQRAHLGRLVAGFAAGALAATGLAVVWVELHGTSPAAVLDAMYAFRVRAGELLLHGAGWEHARPRATLLLVGWVVAGLAGLTLALAVNVRRWARSPVMVALSVTVVFDLVSVALGGGYWGHYLIQTVVPLSIATGVLAARVSVSAVCAAVASIVMTTVPAVLATTAVPTTSTADVIGTSIRQASRPGDTLVTLYGQPQVNLAAGLPSPYPHLWSLPAKTLDPRLSHLDAVLTGPRAPTWLVVLQKVGSWGLDTRRTARIVARHYSPVARWDGQTIYLRDGVTRPAPAPARVRS